MLAARSDKLSYDVRVVSLDILPRQLIHPFFYSLRGSRALHITLVLNRLAGCKIKTGVGTESARIFQGPSVIDTTSTWQTLAISVRAASAFLTSR